MLLKSVFLTKYNFSEEKTALIIKECQFVEFVFKNKSLFDTTAQTMDEKVKYSIREIRLIKVLVFSVFLYALEACTIPKLNRNKIDALEAVTCSLDLEKN